MSKVNILLIGATGVGKSSIVNSMLCGEDDKDLAVEGFGRKSQTKSYKMHSNKIKLGLGQYYKVNVIDTPGFPDTNGLEESVRTYDECIKAANKYEVNLVAFVFNEGRTMDENMKSYKILYDSFTTCPARKILFINNKTAVKRNKRAKAKKALVNKANEMLKTYGLNKIINTNNIVISMSADEIQEKMIKSIEGTTPKKFKLKSYNDIKKTFENSKNYKIDKRKTLKNYEKLIADKRNHIRTLKISLASVVAGAALVGGGLALFTFGISAAVSAGTAAATVAGLEIGIAVNERELSNMEDQVKIMKREYNNSDEEYKKEKKYFDTLTKALQ